MKLTSIVWGAILSASAYGGSITVTGLSVPATAIPGGFAAADASNGTLSCTNLTVTTNGTDTITLSSDFTCLTSCPASTISFSYSGLGLDTTYLEFAQVAGYTGAGNQTFSGALTYDNVNVDGDQNHFVNVDASGSFSVSGTPIAVDDSGLFTGGAEFGILGLSDGATLHITGAQIYFAASTVPEPGSMALFGAGLAAAALMKRRNS